MRIDKFICKSTDLTRDLARTALQSFRVTVNGQVSTDTSTQVHEDNCIKLDDHILTPRPSRYIMLHKPLNTLCSNVDGTYPSILHHIQIDKVMDLHMAGRLDVDTTGLVLLTDDGRWSFNIISPKKCCEKVYRVGLRDPIKEDVEARFAFGIQLQGEAKLTLPAKLTIVNLKEVLLTISEGRYHQVKRMFATVGNRVVSLHRHKIGEVNLDVEPGQWRHLTPTEIKSFGDLTSPVMPPKPVQSQTDI